MWKKSRYLTMKKIKYFQIQRSKRPMHWSHFKSVRDISHVPTVKKFLFHSAAKFLGERDVYILLKTAETVSHSWSAKLDFKSERTGNFTYWSRFRNPQGFSQQQTIKKLCLLFGPTDSGWSRGQPQLGSFSNDQGRKRRETLGTRLTQGECYYPSRHETVNYDALSMTR